MRTSPPPPPPPSRRPTIAERASMVQMAQWQESGRSAPTGGHRIGRPPLPANLKTLTQQTATTKTTAATTAISGGPRHNNKTKKSSASASSAGQPSSPSSRGLSHGNLVRSKSKRSGSPPREIIAVRMTPNNNNKW